MLLSLIFLLTTKPVSISIFLWQRFAKTAKRGFFCDDETLMANFYDELVSVEVLLAVSILVPITTIVFVEVLVKPQDGKIQLFNLIISRRVIEIAHNISTFLIGFLMNLLITQIGKYLVGRYRPHFLSTCQPVLPDGTNCSYDFNKGRYIDTFECSNSQLDNDQAEDLRRSWPSGHSSISFYSMIYISIYLFMQRDFLKDYRLLKSSSQFVFVSFAWISALSRIGDSKHHCEFFVFHHHLKAKKFLIHLYSGTDVLSGSIIGSLVAIFIISNSTTKKVELNVLPTIKLRNESVETLRL